MACRAFTLIEVLVASALTGGLVVVLYAAMAGAVPMVESFQDNARVTQILSDKLDTIRLYNWDQLTGGAVQTNFVLGVNPHDTNSRPYYTGAVEIVQAPIAESYRSNLLQVTVTMRWVTGSRPQSQSMMTYVAKYGMQSYIMQP